MKKNPQFRRFSLNRLIDASGVSGVGIVAYGCEFATGTCVINWPNYDTIGIYKSMGDLVKIHGHEGKTVVEYYD